MKEQLLRRLREQTYVRLGISPVHGIGVFAATNIPKGNREFLIGSSDEWIKLTFEETESLPVHVKQLIETYMLYDDHHYFVPAHGFNLIDPVIYLNHGSNPNIISINDGEYFESLRDISAGEELLIDYGTLADGLEDYNT